MRLRIVGCLLAAVGMLVLPGAVMAQCQSCGGAAACALSGCGSGGCASCGCASASVRRPLVRRRAAGANGDGAADGQGEADGERNDLRPRTADVHRDHLRNRRRSPRPCSAATPRWSKNARPSECYQVAVPVQRVVEQSYQVQVPTYRDVQRQYTVCVPVAETKTEQYTVMVPHCETRQGTRTVTQCVAVQESYTRCVDRGHWEQREVPCGGSRQRRRLWELRQWLQQLREQLRKLAGGCGGCAPAPSCCATTHVCTWVPNVVQEQVPYTVMKPKCVEESYTYQVQVCKPEVRTRTYQVCSYKQEVRTATEKVCEYRCETRVNKVTVNECKYKTKTREVPYTVCVPKTETRSEQVTTYECKAVPKTSDLHRDGPEVRAERRSRSRSATWCRRLFSPPANRVSTGLPIELRAVELRWLRVLPPRHLLAVSLPTRLLIR